MSVQRELAKAAATAALAIGLSAGLGAAASATVITTFPVQTVAETASGFTGVIPGTTINVASDGEASFDPFGFGADTSDGIQLTSSWQPVTATGAFAAGFWQEIPGTNTWVLPATTPCGTENEPSCEPVAEWFFPGFHWGEGNASLRILDSDGVTLSDLVTIGNTADGATITFASDPIGVPEPATWAMMLLGLGALGAMLRAARRSASPAIA
jgi:hypothetical protein